MKTTSCIILDCSVTMAWALPDERMTKKADDVLLALQNTKAIAPSLWLFEVANVLCMAERQKKITRTESSDFKGFLQELPITIEHNTSRIMNDIYALAKNEQLTVYDATYLELALREKAILATFDEALKKAAKKNDVRVF